MLFAGQLATGRSLSTYLINLAFDNHDVAEISHVISSADFFVGFYLNELPVNKKLGRHVSDIIVHQSHIRGLAFYSSDGAIRDLVTWIASRNTLVNMTSLESVTVTAHREVSVLDCSALFPLLLTSRSLHSFSIRFGGDNTCTDDVMSALLSFLGSASLSELEFCSKSLSEAAFTALCDGVAFSTVRRLSLNQFLLQELSLEMSAESLARMILESSLEDVWITRYFEGIRHQLSETWSERFISALKLTANVQNMDFAFTQVGDGISATHLRINRKWKPLVSSANTPLALWPYILEKSHVSPETSHGSADILFFFLRQRPDLVPAP